MYRYDHLNKSSLDSSIFLKSIKGGPETTKCESHRPGPQSIPRTVPTSVPSTGYGAKHTRPPFRYASTPLGTLPNPWMSGLCSGQRPHAGPLRGGRSPCTQPLWPWGMSVADRRFVLQAKNMVPNPPTSLYGNSESCLPIDLLEKSVPPSLNYSWSYFLS